MELARQNSVRPAMWGGEEKGGEEDVIYIANRNGREKLL